MGLFSSIGNAISGVGRALSGAARSIASGISSVCTRISGGFLSTVSGGLGSIVTSLSIPILSIPQIGVVLTVIDTVTKIISYVAQALGIKKEETAEELAMKAEKADKKPEDFDSTQQYIDYIRNDISLNKEEKDSLKTMSPEERAKYQIVGNALYIKEIKEKYNVEIPEEFWVDMAKIKASGEEVKSYLDVFNEKGFSSMKDMSAYMKGESITEGVKKSDISSAMYEAIKRESPELDEDTIYTMLNRNPDAV